MPLSVYARRRLVYGLRSEAAGDDVADVVDAGSGTLKADTIRRLQFMAVSRSTGLGIEAAVEAGTALSGQQQTALGMICNSRPAAAEIAAALAAP
jgi:hypothetical protein